LALFIARSQLSSLLGCPEPIPIVDLFLTNTIAFDFTYLQILNAKIRLSVSCLDGFFLETTFKFFLLIIKSSES
tara:strand:+ start:199 stop:420 length:222 start_codon:yes stop_codon:yes gene_type:complete